MLFTEGKIVTGSYYGIAFAGRVSNVRFHTMNIAVRIVFVDLIDEIEINGGTRTGLALHVYADGTGWDGGRFHIDMDGLR